MRQLYVWKTYNDLLEQFHYNYEKVDLLVARKFAENKWRFHPEYENDTDMMQFSVLAETSAAFDKIDEDQHSLKGDAEVTNTSIRHRYAYILYICIEMCMVMLLDVCSGCMHSQEAMGMHILRIW